MKPNALMVACTLFAAACAGQDWNVADPVTSEEQTEVNTAMSELQTTDPGIKDVLGRAHGYAILPSVGKGGLIVGGAHGSGFVYEQGKIVGRTELSQLSVGAQAGGQSYSEVLLFRDKAAIDKFKAGEFELGAQVSAVVVRQGAATQAGYDAGGMMVLILPQGGAMAEAAVGGQKFSYEPLAQ